MKPRTVSVVLPTYNGVRWISEQINSIADQTHQPDEVIILDDCSSDGTYEYLHEYIHANKLSDRWQLIVNEENQGWRHNFKQLLTLSSCDLVFLCDQDDVWHHDKIERMLMVMDAHPEINVLASLVEEFHDDGSPVTVQDFPQVRFGADGEFAIPSLSPTLMNILRLGCTFCVRGAFVSMILPYWNDERFSHDEVLWRFAAVDGSLGLLEEPFVKWRRTGTNASHAIGGRSRRERIASTETLLAFRDPIHCYLSAYPNPASEEISRLYFDWVEARLLLLKRNMWPLNLSRILRHLGYYSRKRTFFADLACSIVDLPLKHVK